MCETVVSWRLSFLVTVRAKACFIMFNLISSSLRNCAAGSLRCRQHRNRSLRYFLQSWMVFPKPFVANRSPCDRTS